MNEGEEKKKVLEEEISTTEQTDVGSNWLVVFGTLMMIFLIFFLLLYVFSYTAESVVFEKFVTSVEKTFALKGKIKERTDIKMEEATSASTVSEYLKEKGLDRFTKVEITSERIRISLATPILFEIGKAVIKPEAENILMSLAMVIKNLKGKVIVEGHTCNLPIYTKEYKSNWELAADRAINVINFFVRNCKIPPQKFCAAAYGEFRPIASNETEEGRKKNRRIELVVLRE